MTDLMMPKTGHLLHSRSPVQRFPKTTAVPIDDPMAVFIDEPTGYTFTWTRDAGWKFVGHITDENHCVNGRELAVFTAAAAVRQ